MKFHYFDQDKADESDSMLKMAIQQGYVPTTCLLAGMVVMNEVNNGKNACAGCECDRQKCHGRAKTPSNEPVNIQETLNQEWATDELPDADEFEYLNGCQED